MDTNNLVAGYAADTTQLVPFFSDDEGSTTSLLSLIEDVASNITSTVSFIKSDSVTVSAASPLIVDESTTLSSVVTTVNNQLVPFSGNVTGNKTSLLSIIRDVAKNVTSTTLSFITSDSADVSSSLPQSINESTTLPSVVTTIDDQLEVGSVFDVRNFGIALGVVFSIGIAIVFIIATIKVVRHKNSDRSRQDLDYALSTRDNHLRRKYSNIPVTEL